MKNTIYNFLLLLSLIVSSAMQSNEKAKILNHSFLLGSVLSTHTVCLVDIEVSLEEKKYEILFLDEKDEEKMTFSFQVQKSEKGWVCKTQDTTIPISENGNMTVTISIPADTANEAKRIAIAANYSNKRIISQSVNF